eukprot:6175878-Pleurochrysis_carterae.AAC.2
MLSRIFVRQHLHKTEQFKQRRLFGPAAPRDNICGPIGAKSRKAVSHFAERVHEWQREQARRERRRVVQSLRKSVRQRHA